MRVLITGATGLIGQEIVKLCHEKDIKVNYLTTSKSKIVQEENYKGFYWNPKTSEIDSKSIENVDVIVHLAGASVAKKWTNSYKEEIIESRVLSTRLLYQTLQKNHHQVRQIVTASAIGIYPNSLDSIYHETDLDIDDSFLGNVVKQWENEVNQFEKLPIIVSKIIVDLDVIIYVCHVFAGT